ncbi:DUF1446-domain-containing protein, partial [Violaceomyces palustris]
MMDEALSSTSPVPDVAFGDYLAEVNLAMRALEISRDPTAGFEVQFLRQISRNLEKVAQRRIRVISNAGALNPKGLAEKISDLCKEKGLDLKIAYTGGDNILPTFQELQASGEIFGHLEDGRAFDVKKDKILSANAYLGAWPIVEALEAGADIIITGRCTDASPVIAAAAWWHGWSRSADYDKLAQALLAGHAIECGGYVTGGNCGAFKPYLETGNYFNLSPPVAEISHDGDVIITKIDSCNGWVNVDTVTHQILYEIQGNIYLNPDVTADIHNISVVEAGENRVRISGVKGYPPPHTTKIAICSVGGYQAEYHTFATGPDVDEKKAAKLEFIRKTVPDLDQRFTTFEIQQFGVPQENPRNENLASVFFRIFAQGPTLDSFRLEPTSQPDLKSIINQEGLGCYNGMYPNLDFRLSTPKPYAVYWPGLMDARPLKQWYELLKPKREIDAGETTKDRVLVTNPPGTVEAMKSEDYDSGEGPHGPIPTEAIQNLGPTKSVPLGTVTLARSGDKGGNANVGFYVRNADEYDWLRKTLNKATFRSMMAEEDIGAKVERVEFPGLLAVHFLCHDIL